MPGRPWAVRSMPIPPARLISRAFRVSAGSCLAPVARSATRASWKERLRICRSSAPAAAHATAISLLAHLADII
eukprot:7905612-Pyramimonas_sp.AAC.1